MNKIMIPIGLVMLVLLLIPSVESQEFVYAEMEFPLSFVSNVRQYKFNPLSRFQTQVEGRLIELSSDPLVDIYQDRGGRQKYRSCLGKFRIVRLQDRLVLNFNLEDLYWPQGNKISFEDVWFSLEYRKLSPQSWNVNKDLIIVSKGKNSFDAYFGNNSQSAPKPGEFYFPIVNKQAFKQSGSPSEAAVDKRKQNKIGYGRYAITKVKKNEFIRLKRNTNHPFYKNLKLPANTTSIDSIRMKAYPNARINRNEQFIGGSVHMITEATQLDVGYISGSVGTEKVKVSRYSDDSFTGFVFNCQHPYLEPSPVRRAFNYVTNKRLMLKKALGGEGEIVSGPIPRKNFFYNITIPPYRDNIKTAIAIIELYRYWGLDAYQTKKGVKILSAPVKGPASDLAVGDLIVDVEKEPVKTLQQFISALNSSKDPKMVVRVIRDGRLSKRDLDRSISLKSFVWKSVHVVNSKLEGFPKLTLIANNPRGRFPIVKQICGALKEDLEKIGVEVDIDYLSPKEYYPRLQKGEFSFAFRTLKLIGTPNLYRMFYYNKGDTTLNSINYGRYANQEVNKIAVDTRDITEKAILKKAWKKAHQVLHDDPPYIYLWSRKHIVVYTPRLDVATPNAEYDVAHGYKQINGMINVFSEVHLWNFKDD